VILLGSGIAAPTLSAVSGCSGSSFNFGVVQVGASASCTFTLLNSNPQAVAVATIAVNGLGFTGPLGVSTPFTLQPAQSATFSIQFTPPTTTSFAGTLTIGTQSFSLSGIGALPPIPTPALQFDSTAFGSAQQRVLTMTIPGGSPTAFSGYVNLAFTPSTAVVSDDTEIVFLANGARSVPFTVAKNATQVLLNGQGSATFQTGTTEGAITFTVSTAAQFKGDPTTTFTIPGAKVMIESVTASKQRLGSLDITITGADNTYSTGPMSFSFFDTSGNLTGSAVTSDFSADFKKYYGTVKAGGSTFLALVSFPVIGSVAGIGGVTVTLTNAAGIASTASIPFN
jgi:hypothetical protein